MWLGPVGGGKDKPEGTAETPAGGDGQSTLQASRQVYEAVKGQYYVHDRANENLEKKAQNCMVASALVATLLVTAAMAYEAGRLVWDSFVLNAAIASVTGLVLTIVLCMLVNKASPYPVTIMGGRLLCCDNLDEKTYDILVNDEEDFYKLNIAEYARALVKLEDTNKKKAQKLTYAHIAFAASITLALIVVVAAIASPQQMS